MTVSDLSCDDPSNASICDVDGYEVFADVDCDDNNVYAFSTESEEVCDGEDNTR